jgi:hypothetical protein
MSLFQVKKNITNLANLAIFLKIMPHPKIQTKLSKLQICFQFSLIIKFV